MIDLVPGESAALRRFTDKLCLEPKKRASRSRLIGTLHSPRGSPCPDCDSRLISQKSFSTKRDTFHLSRTYPPTSHTVPWSFTVQPDSVPREGKLLAPKNGVGRLSFIVYRHPSQQTSDFRFRLVVQTLRHLHAGFLRCYARVSPRLGSASEPRK